MRKHSRLVAMLVGGVVAAVALAVPVSAHHGWGAYQETQFEITGTLATPVSLAGSHATATMKVNDDVWELVFAPPARTERAGLTEDVIPVGDEVTASGHRHLDASKLEIKTERLTWNGRVFDVYPERN
jgi:Family of unknown function (DUF6152)